MQIIYFIFFACFSFITNADVIKPTLAEASFSKNKLELQLELSLEAILTNIGTQYQNTTNSPNAAEYYKLRLLSSNQLLEVFRDNQQKVLDSFVLKINNQELVFNLDDIKIDNLGNIKRHRKTTIKYSAEIDNPQQLFWSFNEIYGDNAFRFRFVEKDKYTWQGWNYLKSGDNLDIDITKYKQPSITQTLIKFIELGFYHVIPLGLDHILFIITMALGVFTLRRAIVLVTSFTLAHTITLGLATYNVVSIPASIIEPIIALSIAIMAIDKLFFNIKDRYNSILVFVFGLLHGLGFALMLKEFISNRLITSLVGFNIGVELAQISIVILTIFILKFLTKFKVINISVDIILSRLIATSIMIIGLIMFFSRI